MHSIGNDIVDLSERGPPLHSRYIARVFSQSERRQIGDSWPDLWLHWAAKEAAYKTLKRLLPHISFVPKEFEFNPARREVRAQNHSFDCKWIVNQHYVYVSCATKSLARSVAELKNWIEKVASSSVSKVNSQMTPQSYFVRALARRNIAKELSVASANLEISVAEYSTLTPPNESRADDAIPRLFVSNQESEHLLSFTHHGRFAACAFHTI